MDIFSEKNSMEAMLCMWRLFYKVLKVDLTQDSYEIIKTLDDEMRGDKGFYPNSVSTWLRSFADTGRVYEADVDVYRQAVALEALRSFFRHGENCFRLRYRRRIGAEIRWVSLELLKSDEYKDTSQIVFLFVRDIHDSYIKELEVQREMELNCRFDALTGLNNYYSYQQLCRKFKKNCSLGVIFCDLNGLKLTNDRFGHAAGNKLLVEFAKDLQYQFFYENLFRISGDEFLVLLFGLDKEAFNAIAKQYVCTVKADKIPKASVGYAFDNAPKFIESVAHAAELCMYKDKDSFYEKHEEFQRGLASENYRSEMNGIVRNLAASYDVIATVDLDNDSYWILKSFNDKESECKDLSYTRYYHSFVLKVKPEFHDLMVRFGGIRLLKKNLKKTPAQSVEIELLDASWQRFTFRLLETKQGEVSKVLLLIERMNHENVDTQERNDLAKYERSIIDGLASGFSMISIIDVPKRMFLMYKNYALSSEISSAVKALDFDNARLWFCKTYVIESDQRSFMELTKLSRLYENVQERSIVSFKFGTTPAFHHAKCAGESEFLFYRLKEDKQKIAFVTRSVTS